MLPPVYSTTGWPDCSRPSRSAPSIMARAMRSLYEPVGLAASSFTQISAMSPPASRSNARSVYRRSRRAPPRALPVSVAISRPYYTAPMAGSTRLIPLGGLGEVGKNMLVVESDDGIVVIDAGLSFPRDEHLASTSCCRTSATCEPTSATSGPRDHARPRGHTGALPFLLREVRVPEVWATRLTLGLIQSKLDEHGLLQAASSSRSSRRVGRPGSGRTGSSSCRMAHSIPDSVAVVSRRPAAASSTPGTTRSATRRWTASGPTSASSLTSGTAAWTSTSRRLDERRAPGSNSLREDRWRGLPPDHPAAGRARLIASFASNVHRVQQAIDVALESRRRVCLVGRSLRKNVNIARNLGYIDVPDHLLVKPDVLPSSISETMILCTGARGADVRPHADRIPRPSLRGGRAG